MVIVRTKPTTKAPTRRRAPPPGAGKSFGFGKECKNCAAMKSDWECDFCGTYTYAKPEPMQPRIIESKGLWQ